MSQEPVGRRSGGRAARQTQRSSPSVEVQPYLTRTTAPVEIVSDEGLELIEHNADTILEEVGIDFATTRRLLPC